MHKSIFGMETPLRGRSGGHAGTAPTVPFGQIARGWLMSLERIARKWLFCLCGMCGKILRRWVGAAPVCPPMSPCKDASVVQYPAHNTCIFGMETPLRERSGGHIGTAPTVSFGQITHGRLLSFGWIVRKCITEFGRGGACVPARVALQGRIHR